MASPKPQVIVRREFELRPDVTAQPLNACIIGPASRAVSFLDRDSLLEPLNITDPYQAPEYSGKIEGITNGRVTAFIQQAGDPDYGLELGVGGTTLLTDDVSSAAATISDGYTVEVNTIKVSAENGFVRLMRNAVNEEKSLGNGGFAGATQSGASTNVIDCGISVVSKPGYPRSTLLVDDVKVGDQVYLVNDAGGSINKRLTKIIGFQTETTGQVKKIVLANNVMDGDDTPTLVSIRRRVAEVHDIPEIGGFENAENFVPNWRWNKGDGTVDNILYYGGSKANNDQAALAGGLNVKVPGLGTGWFEMTSAHMYISYTAYRTDLTMEVTTIQNISDIEETFGTDLHPDNLLAWAVYTAKLNSGGQPVYYIPTPGQGLADYVSALAVAETERSCYSLVPCTENTAVLSAVEGHIDNMSAPETGKFRVGWFAPEITPGRVIANTAGTIGQELGALAIADSTTGSAPSSTSTHVTITSDKQNAFKDARIGAIVYGDIESGAPDYDQYVTGDYSSKDRDEVVITAIGNQDEITGKITNISSNNDSGNTMSNAWADPEMYEEVSGSVLAAEYGASAGGYDNERVFAVVPDRGINGMRVNGEGVKNVHLAAAFAGLRSSSAVQQPLSNVTINGFDNLNKGAVIFSETDFSTMRDAGTWVVRQPKTGNQAGKIFAQRQLSTKNLDIYRKEQSVTTNIDNVAFALLDGLFQYVGRVNITDASMALIRDAIESILREKTSAATATLGPQLISYEIKSLEQLSSSLGTLKVQVTLDVPLPMNVIDLTLVI